MSNLDFSGLDSFSDLTKGAALRGGGQPLDLALDSIDEDPAQPRRHFDEEALQELAASIKAKGVKSPISVRPHPTQPGRYIINHGARRYRASKLAEQATVRAFVDESHDDVDQLAENIQREDLSTREIVDAIARRLKDGDKQADLVRSLGKSKSWISKHAALADLPAPLAELLATGRCRDASTLYELLQLWKAHEGATAEFLARNSGAIVQADVEALRASLKRQNSGQGTSAAVGIDAAEDAADGRQPTMPPSSSSQAADDENDSDTSRRQAVTPTRSEPDPTKVRKPLVQVRVGRREGVLLVSKPAAYGLAWIQFDDAVQEEIDVAKVKLVAVIDGKK